MALSVACSSREIVNDVSVVVDLQKVLKFGVCDQGHWGRECVGEFRLKTYAARFAEVEMFVVCEVRRQVESIQSVSVGVLGSAEC